MADLIKIYGTKEETDRVLSDDTVEMLEKWLEMAKRGEIVAAALVAEFKDGSPGYGFTRSAATYKTRCVLGEMQDDLRSIMNGGD